MPTLIHRLLLAADEPKKTVLEQLDKETRGKLFWMVLGLILLVMVVSLLIWMGGWLTRRWMAATDARAEELQRQGPRPDDWAEKPLVSLEEPEEETKPPLAP